MGRAARGYENVARRSLAREVNEGRSASDWGSSVVSDGVCPLFRPDRRMSHVGYFDVSLPRNGDNTCYERARGNTRVRRCSVSGDDVRRRYSRNKVYIVRIPTDSFVHFVQSVTFRVIIIGSTTVLVRHLGPTLATRGPDFARCFSSLLAGPNR